VDQLSLEQNALSEQSMQISELEAANSSLKETIAELTAKLESLEEDQASQQIQKRFHMKIRELETRMELETTTKGRLEGQVARLKEHIEKLHEDVKAAQTREYLVIDKYKKVERQLRDCKEEINRNSQKDTEAQSRRIMLEKQLDSADLEISTLKNDLKLAMQRIEDLTAAIKECDEVSEDDEDEDSSTESVTSDTEITESLPHTHISLDFDCKTKKQRSIADSYS
jgi:myosin-18